MTILNRKTLIHLTGWLIAGVSLYFSIRHVDLQSLGTALASINTIWIAPVVAVNFVVILLKAMRWEVTLRPVKKVGLWMIFRTLVIGFMANNILPARLGDVLRIHILGKDADISRLSTTTTLIADRIMEVISFLAVAGVLVLTTDVPEWMNKGLIITLFTTILAYGLILFYSERNIKPADLTTDMSFPRRRESSFFKKFWIPAFAGMTSLDTSKHNILNKLRAGLSSLRSVRMLSLGLTLSFLSWIVQASMLYMVQLSFGVSVPLWGIVLVLIAVNLAIALPSAPANIGTFEFACILAYSYLGIEKESALLIAVTYHMLQLIPVTLAGGLLALYSYLPAGRQASSTAIRSANRPPIPLING